LGLAEVGEGAKQAEKVQDGHRRTVRFIGRWEMAKRRNVGLDRVGSPLARRQTPRSLARKLISDSSRVSKPSFRIAYDSLGERQLAERLWVLLRGDEAGIIEPGFDVPLFKACADFLVAPPPELSEAPPGWPLAVLPG
jgi:hypothetical protein